MPTGTEPTPTVDETEQGADGDTGTTVADGALDGMVEDDETLSSVGETDGVASDVVGLPLDDRR